MSDIVLIGLSMAVSIALWELGKRYTPRRPSVTVVGPPDMIIEMLEDALEQAREDD